MERVYDDEEVRTIAAIPDGPEKLLLGLRRFPKVFVDKIPLSPLVCSRFEEEVRAHKLRVGQTPLALSVCHAGICRSALVATYLVDKQLASLGLPNIEMETGDVKGCGIDYLDNHGLAFSETGILIHRKTNNPLDLLVLSLSTKFNRSVDRATLTKIGLILNQGLSSIPNLDPPLSIIWLDGTEDEFQQCFVGHL